MGQLYTVKLTTKRMVSFYDKHGRLVSAKEELIPQVYHDLPYSTALSYKTNFPGANVEILQQAQDAPVRANSPARKAIGKRPNKVITDDSDEMVVENDFTAAQTGDMAAAINAEIGQR